MYRKVVYMSKNNQGNTVVENYAASNGPLNTFLGLFDLDKSSGNLIITIDNSVKIIFECSSNFYSLAQTPEFKEAFDRMGVKVVFEDIDT